MAALLPGLAIFLATFVGLLWLRPRLYAWSEANGRREALGRFSDELENEAPCTLTGRLVLDGDGGERLEDGATAAASTMEDTSGAVVVATRAPGRLVLKRDHDSIPLVGPVRVAAGSLETRPLLPVEMLNAATRERIAEHLTTTVPGPVAFRSVAPGDRVIVRGVLHRIQDAQHASYREGTRFVLEPEGDGILVAAVSRPRFRGALLSSLRGPRPPTLALGMVAIVMAVAAGAFAMREIPEPAPEPPAPIVKLTVQACTALAKAYAGHASNAARCEADAECKSEQRQSTWFGLDHCFRFVSSKQDIRPADTIAQQWLDGGCASEFEICEPPPPAQCLNNRCVELPPEPIPPDWYRAPMLGHSVWLYLPPDVVDENAEGTDSYVHAWKGDTFSLNLDYGRHSARVEPPAPDDPNRDNIEILEIDLDGVKAKLKRETQIEGTDPVVVMLDFPDPPTCASVECLNLVHDDATLTLYAWCKNEAACRIAEQAMRSTRFRRKLTE